MMATSRASVMPGTMLTTAGAFAEACIFAVFTADVHMVCQVSFGWQTGFRIKQTSLEFSQPCFSQLVQLPFATRRAGGAHHERLGMPG